jgi:hypothetical protein
MILNLEADRLSKQEQRGISTRGSETLGEEHEVVRVAAEGEALVGRERGIGGPLLGSTTRS